MTCVGRISGRNCRSSSRAQSGSESPGASDLDDLSDAVLHSGHWTFSKIHFKTSLIAGQSHEFEDIAVRMFNSGLVYTGLGFEVSGKTWRCFDWRNGIEASERQLYIVWLFCFTTVTEIRGDNFYKANSAFHPSGVGK